MSGSRRKTLWFAGGLWVGLVAGASVGMLVAWDARLRVASARMEVEAMQDLDREQEDALRTCERRQRLAEVLAEIHQENYGRARSLLAVLVEDVRLDDGELAEELASIVIESDRPPSAARELSEFLLPIDD